MVFLGTSLGVEEIYEIVETLGFDFKIDPVLMKPYNRKPIHKTVKGLELQIHQPVYHRNVEGISHDIEYMADYDFPEGEEDNHEFYMVPQHLQVLREMYKKIPDLIYIKDFKEWFDASREDKSKVKRYPLLDYFEEVEKRQSLD